MASREDTASQGFMDASPTLTLTRYEYLEA
jgi:hypothetical protein